MYTNLKHYINYICSKLSQIYNMCIYYNIANKKERIGTGTVGKIGIGKNFGISTPLIFDYLFRLYSDCISSCSNLFQQLYFTESTH